MHEISVIQITSVPSAQCHFIFFNDGHVWMYTFIFFPVILGRTNPGAHNYLCSLRFLTHDMCTFERHHFTKNSCVFGAFVSLGALVSEPLKLNVP